MYDTDELLESTEINGKELEYLLSERKIGRADFLLVDVREEYEYNQKRIVGVDYLIPLSDFFNKVQQIESCKSKHIIAKCKLGGRSAQAQMQLKRMGFKSVINLAGGISHYTGEKE
ncbi:MAG: sulfurtransferase [Flavobacteriales bacterium]|nr:sulfurtransferase [Flavobacteriales bacterium]|tara:strand:+ start:35196 stop:35543 length:348 start_codon:yes stop_codon:yes gene_type:complete